MLRNMISPFENVKVLEKVNYLLREYDLFIQEYAKVTLTLDELSFVLMLFGDTALAGDYEYRRAGTENP